jgi:class 3 adenylate cyclase
MEQLGVELRAERHTGEIQPDGDDISGIAVAIGARVGAIAGFGEVLVSSTVKETSSWAPASRSRTAAHTG